VGEEEGGGDACPTSLGASSEGPGPQLRGHDLIRVHCGIEEPDTLLCALVSRTHESDRYSIDRHRGEEIPIGIRLSFYKAAAYAVGIGCLCSLDSSLNDSPGSCSGVIGLDIKSCIDNRMPLPEWELEALIGNAPGGGGVG